MREFLQFSHFVASKSSFSCEFSWEPLNLLPRNRCFVRGFRQFSAHLTKCHTCHGICTLSPLDSALPMRFAKNTQHDASKVLRLTRKIKMDTSKCRACHENCNASSENVAKVLRLPHNMIFSTCYKTRLNVTKCHACHAKRSNATWETSKNDPSGDLTIGTAI